MYKHFDSFVFNSIQHIYKHTLCVYLGGVRGAEHASRARGSWAGQQVIILKKSVRFSICYSKSQQVEGIELDHTLVLANSIAAGTKFVPVSFLSSKSMKRRPQNLQ